MLPLRILREVERRLYFALNAEICIGCDSGTEINHTTLLIGNRQLTGSLVRLLVRIEDVDLELSRISQWDEAFRVYRSSKVIIGVFAIAKRSVMRLIIRFAASAKLRIRPKCDVYFAYLAW